jgi:hypothetical protein
VESQWWLSEDGATTDFTFNIKQLYRKEGSILGCNSLAYTREEMAVMMRIIGESFENGALSSILGCNSLAYTRKEMAVMMRIIGESFENGALSPPERGDIHAVNMIEALGFFDGSISKPGGAWVQILLALHHCRHSYQG